MRKLFPQACTSWIREGQPDTTIRARLPVQSTSAAVKCWAAFLAFALALGCAPMRQQPVTEDFRKYQEAKKFFEQGLYREALNAYRGVAEAEPHSPWAENAKFNAAYILVYYKNPDRDYTGARREFEEFLLRYPASALVDEAQSWIAVLNAFGQSKVRELLAEVESLTRKADNTAKKLQESQLTEEVLLKERDTLLIDRNNLVKKVDELLYEKDALTNEREALLRDRERLTLNMSDLEQKIQSLGREKEDLVKAKEKLEKSLRDLTMVDVKVEKRRKKMKKEETKSSKSLTTP